jgi:DNA mismatch endonuclease (patch repair protein)
MSRIRGQGNRNTEMAFVKLLRAAGITGWRRHVELSLNPKSGARARLPGRTGRVKPDFVFSAQRLVVFIDGCFWHGCPRHATAPKANAEFWAVKLAGNKARDRYVNRVLRRRGWRVVRIWEHDLKDGRNPIERLDIRESTE